MEVAKERGVASKDLTPGGYFRAGPSETPSEVGTSGGRDWSGHPPHVSTHPCASLSLHLPPSCSLDLEKKREMEQKRKCGREERGGLECLRQALSDRHWPGPLIPCEAAMSLASTR